MIDLENRKEVVDEASPARFRIFAKNCWLKQTLSNVVERWQAHESSVSMEIIDDTRDERRAKLATAKSRARLPLEAQSLRFGTTKFLLSFRRRPYGRIYWPVLPCLGNRRRLSTHVSGRTWHVSQLQEGRIAARIDRVIAARQGGTAPNSPNSRWSIGRNGSHPKFYAFNPAVRTYAIPPTVPGNWTSNPIDFEKYGVYHRR